MKISLFSVRIGEHDAQGGRVALRSDLCEKLYQLLDLERYCAEVELRGEEVGRAG